MAKTAIHSGILTILANPWPESLSEVPDIVVQVLDLKAAGNRYMFSASDGNMRLKAILKRFILDYSLNDIPNKSDKYLIVTKCDDVVSVRISKEARELEKKKMS